MNNKIGRVAFSVMGKFEETVTMAMLTVTLAVTVVNVFARYIFTSSIPWAQEVTGIAWTWTCMLGISWCYRRNMHMGVEFFIEKLKPNMHRVVLIFTFSILTIAFAFMVYMSAIIAGNGNYKFTNYFQIPYTVKYISAVIAFFNMTVYSLCFVINAITKPAEFLKRVSLSGNGLDPLPEDQNATGLEGEV